MWKITHDMLADGDADSRVGMGCKLQTPSPELPLTFRLLDDDLEHYYTCKATDDAYLNDEEHGGLMRCWEWAMADSGCTHLCIKLDDAVRLGMGPAIAERIAFPSGPHKGWVTLYG